MGTGFASAEAHPRHHCAMTHMSDDAVTPAPEPTNGKILVVEDDPDIRSILQRFLARRGYAVKAAENGAEALELLAHEPVDLILSDVRMPRMDGLELLGAVRQRDPEVQLVLMTAYSTVRDAVEAIQAGAADY